MSVTQNSISSNYNSHLSDNSGHRKSFKKGDRPTITFKDSVSKPGAAAAASRNGSLERPKILSNSLKTRKNTVSPPGSPAKVKRSTSRGAEALNASSFKQRNSVAQ